MARTKSAETIAAEIHAKEVEARENELIASKGLDKTLESFLKVSKSVYVPMYSEFVGGEDKELLEAVQAVIRRMDLVTGEMKVTFDKFVKETQQGRYSRKLAGLSTFRKEREEKEAVKKEQDINELISAKLASLKLK